MLDNIVGNEHIKAQLSIAYGAARLNNRPLPHMLLSGRPGCGKTTTAKALAELGGAKFVEVSAEGLKTAEDIQRIFENLPDDGYGPSGEIIGEIKPAIIFVDEAHRLTLKSEEMLGISMENWTHTFSEGRGKKKQVLTTWVPQFTLVCATTKEGSFSKPFRDRFKLVYIFNEYDLEESIEIVKKHASKKGISLTDNAAVRIAQRGRGTPRTMVRFLERMVDAMLVLGQDELTVEIVEAQFQLMGIDPEGLTRTDIAILKKLNDSELPVGLESLALLTNQDQETIREVNEPYLLTTGLMERGKQGRVITNKGIEHLVKYGHIEETVEETKTIKRVLSRTG